MTGVIALTAMASIMLAGCSDNLAGEKTREMADLQGMRGAELTAMQEWRGRLPDATVEYWYDPDTFELFPTSDKKPSSFGLGTKGKGGAVKEFEEITGMSYEYEEGADYTSKVIHVIVTGEDGKLDVKVDWVDAG